MPKKETLPTLVAIHATKTPLYNVVIPSFLNIETRASRIPLYLGTGLFAAPSHTIFND